jgi:hypothetical protein
MCASFSWLASPLFYRSLLSYAAHDVGARFSPLACAAANAEIISRHPKQSAIHMTKG